MTIMATIFETVAVSVTSPQTEFSGSSEQDIQLAKTFWQSIHLLPPPESRLISADIAQRLPHVPPGQSMPICNKRAQKSMIAAQHYNRIAYQQAYQDHYKEVTEKIVFKEAAIKRLQIQQAKRKEAEKISQPFRPSSPQEVRPILPDKMAGDF